MIKKFVLIFCILLSLNSIAQEGTASPYSYYGLGEMKFKGSVENRSMGSLSVMSDSIHINLQNPAFYPDLKFTTFTLGVSHLTTKLQTATDEANARRSSLDYMAVAFPIGEKIGASFGLMPLTSIGYKIKTMGDEVTPNKTFTGTGGINRAFAGAGYEIMKNLSVGAEFAYHFGNIETTSIYSIEGVQDGSRELNESSVGGPGMTVGLSYKAAFGKNKQLFVSSSFSPAATLTLNNERKLAVVQILINDAIRVLPGEVDVPVADTKVKIPAKFSIGGGLGETKKWMLGAEATFTHNTSLRNRFSDISSDVLFENSVRFSIGGFYIPNHASFTSYLKRMTYRAGARYENTGLVINGQSINDLGMTLGIGLPLGGTFSNINIGFEYGKRGTTNAGLIAENYLNFTLALSLNDRWFVKRKFD